jgi:prophage regulatory protein
LLTAALSRQHTLERFIEMAIQTHPSETVLRLPGVKGISGLGRSSIYAGVKAGTFPAPIKLGDRAIGWLDSEVQTWVKSRAASRTNAKGATV